MGLLDLFGLELNEYLTEMVCEQVICSRSMDLGPVATNTH